MSEFSSTFASGRIINGQHSGKIPFTLSESGVWNKETQGKYMDQVRERAQDKAREILEEALAQAEEIRLQAQAQGFMAGQKEAQHVVDQEKQKLMEFLKNLHLALEQEKKQIFSEHKDLLFQILRLAFEKTLGTVLEEHRFQVLRTLFTESVAQLDAQAVVTMLVGPEDEENATQILAEARKTQPHLPEIVLQITPDLDPGGLRLESGQGMIDNSISSRLEQVQNILDGYLAKP